METTRIQIKDLKDQIGKYVTISGFVHTIRDQGKIKFIVIRDITGSIQTVVLKSHDKAFEVSNELTLESVVSVSGILKETPQAPLGIEIEAEVIEVLSLADAVLPIPVVEEKGGDEVNITARFDNRWLDLRKKEKQEIFKVWTQLEEGFREYLISNDYIQFYAPSFMGSPSESGAEVFKVEYFDRSAYLAQSPQFYKQMAMSAGFEKVFCIGPVFRAEPSFTTRHMTEFTGWDIELSYIVDHFDIMEVEEQALIAAFTKVKETLMPDLEVPKAPFPKISMAKAKDMLAEKGIKSEKQYDLSPEEEREICKIIKEKENHDFVFITDYHISIRPFYHMRHKDNPEYTMSFDLLYKGVEITTGAKREHRFEILKAQAEEKGVNLTELEYYFNFFKYGCPPHGGMGIGPGRIIMQLLDLPNVKEATFLPRDVKRISP